MISRHKARIRHLLRFQLKDEELLPDDPNYDIKNLAMDPGITLWELLYFWRKGVIRPSTAVMAFVTTWIVISWFASATAVLLHEYIFIIPFAIWTAILSYVLTIMVLGRRRIMASGDSQIPPGRWSREGARNAVVLVTLAIVTVMLIFILVDSGALDNNAHIRITVGSIHSFLVVSFDVYVDASLIGSDTLEPHESLVFEYTHRWTDSEPANITISVKYSGDFWDGGTADTETITVLHGESYAVSLSV